MQMSPNAIKGIEHCDVLMHITQFVVYVCVTLHYVIHGGEGHVFLIMMLPYILLTLYNYIDLRYYESVLRDSRFVVREMDAPTSLKYFESIISKSGMYQCIWYDTTLACMGYVLYMLMGTFHHHMVYVLIMLACNCLLLIQKYNITTAVPVSMYEVNVQARTGYMILRTHYLWAIRRCINWDFNRFNYVFKR